NEDAHSRCMLLRSLRESGSRALHLPHARPGELLFLRLYEVAATAERHGSRTRSEIRSEKISRLHPRAGVVAARPDAQGGDGGFHSGSASEPLDASRCE